jgi:hypothetical protein
MTNPLILSDAQQVIGRRWSEGQPPERERILVLARDALVFISATGQWYPFVDFRGDRASSNSSRTGTAHGLQERLSETERFFEELLDQPEAAGEQPAIQVILDALRFISSTRQHEAFGDFLERVASDDPPLVVASFATQAEADAWLKHHPNPPAFADVLIGNRYHVVAYQRETDFRRLPWTLHFERYLAWLKRVHPPVAQASFATHEEAEAWLASQPKPARRTWVMIAGEFYLAVHHPNINHRALYPLSMAVSDED